MKFRSFKTPENLTKNLCDLLSSEFKEPHNIMLSGGSTPYKVYNQIAQKNHILHPQCKIFLSDERCVAANSPKNNAYNLKPMLKSFNRSDQFIAINTGLTPKDAASDFANKLSQISTFHFGLLGIGTDGHTAGIFNYSETQSTDSNLTLYTKRPDNMNGVSVSSYLIKRFERVIILATGENKREILNKLKEAPEKLIAGNILLNHSNTEIWNDININ